MHHSISLSFPEDGVDTDRNDGSSDLPAYLSASPSVSSPIGSSITLTEHSSSLSSRGKPWLTLTLTSSANSDKSLPAYLEGQEITGRLDLNLENSEHIRAIKIIVKGLLVISGVDMIQFLEISQTLWDASNDDIPGATTASREDQRRKSLVGNHEWPISIMLPKNAVVTRKQAKDLNINTTQILPPSFAENGIYSIITYELTVAVKRSGPFRANSVLTAPFAYLPRSRPGVPSEFRQLAYREHAPLLGPEIDPSGWRLLNPAKLKGILFDKEKVEMQCTLALALPLSYTRGSVIPCLLILESDNTQALDLLSKTDVPAVQLRRKVNLDNNGLSTTVESESDKSQVVSKALWMRRRRDDNVNLTDGMDNGFKRVMEGEIPIPDNLVPSFTFGKYFLDYRIDLLPLKTAGFYPTDASRLRKQKVKITTDYPPGPRPIAYLPPEYDGTIAESSSPSTFARTLNMIAGFL